MNTQDRNGDEACDCPFCDIVSQLHRAMGQAFGLFLDEFLDQFGERPVVSEVDGKFTVSACGCAIETEFGQNADPALLWLIRIRAVRLLIPAVSQKQAHGDAAA